MLLALLLLVGGANAVLLAGWFSVAAVAAVIDQRADRPWAGVPFACVGLGIVGGAVLATFAA